MTAPCMPLNRVAIAVLVVCHEVADEVLLVVGGNLVSVLDVDSLVTSIHFRDGHD